MVIVRGPACVSVQLIYSYTVYLAGITSFTMIYETIY